MNITERDALLAMLLTPGIGHGLARRCVEQFGSASAALSAGAMDLRQLDRVGTTKAAKLRRHLDQTLDSDRLGREHSLMERVGVALVGMADSAYPRLLRLIPDPPLLLWVRGQLRESDALALAIVGSRRCTHYGREQADRLTSLCAEAGLCIISGGAYGIDATAHRAALRAGGRTIAVLGSGLARPYPEEHSELFDRMAIDQDDARGSGALLSEFPMETPPIAENFPRRNRILSGLALGVLVVEAAVRSGALITARLCVEDHGREAMAIPGRVDSAASKGCHQMIREGWAALVTGLPDVLDALGEAGQILKAGTSSSSSSSGSEQRPTLTENLSDTQHKIMVVLEQPRSLDQIAAWTKLPIWKIQADLTQLEIRGTVRRKSGLFVRRAEPH